MHGGRVPLGVGVAVGVGVGDTTGGVGPPVGEVELAPHWMSVTPATSQALESARCLRFIFRLPATHTIKHTVTLQVLVCK